jgi:type VI secretion system protein ImpA
MSVKPVLDLEVLLVPIPGDNPSGSDVHYTRYDAIREARREDDGLPKGDWEEKGPVKVAEWKKVVELTTKILATESKDLQIAAWLLEAMVKEEGFPGLRDGLALMKELHQRFWDTLYPPIEQDGGRMDLGYRAGPLDWLNEEKTLPMAIRNIAFLRGPEGQRYGLLQWEEAQAVENLGRKDPKQKVAAINEKKMTVEEINKAVQATSLATCVEIMECLQESQEEIEELNQVIKEKFGEANPDRPSCENVKRVLEDCRTVLEAIVKQKGGAKVELQGAVAETKDTVVTRPGEPVGSTGGGIHPSDRVDALRRLAAVVEFFNETEPHSPVGPLVQRAAKWGEMPLKEWLEEVIPNKEVLGKVLETLGMAEKKPPQ